MPDPQGSQNQKTEDVSDQLVQNKYKSILLAEDNEAIAAATTICLQSVGFTVLLANNGGKVIEMANTHHPDLILMDIQMPGIDGLEAIETIRATASISATPIIALTGNATRADKAQCLQAGADQYLSKPYPLDDLMQRINQIFKA